MHDRHRSLRIAYKSPPTARHAAGLPPHPRGGFLAFSALHPASSRPALDGRGTRPTLLLRSASRAISTARASPRNGVSADVRQTKRSSSSPYPFPTHHVLLSERDCHCRIPHYQDRANHSPARKSVKPLVSPAGGTSPHSSCSSWPRTPSGMAAHHSKAPGNGELKLVQLPLENIADL